MSEFAGLLKSRVEIWRRKEERLPSGLASETWECLGQFWAAVEAEGVGKQVEGMSLSALARFRIMVRARPDLAVDQRVHWQGRHLTVQKMLFDPALPDRMTLHCEEVRR